MFDIGWTEILILATVSLFIIGPREIPKFLGFIGKMIAKVRGMSRELQDSVDDAIKNSELEDIRKEISLADPELSKNLQNIMGSNKPNNTVKSEDADNDIENTTNLNKKNNNKDDTNAFKTKVSKNDLPSGLKHIKDKDLNEENS